MKGVVLYGAPATGKDTVAGALCVSGRFRHYARVKCGPGRTAGYRMVDVEGLDGLRAVPGEVLWETRRYWSSYLVVRSHLLELASVAVPVVAVGEPEAVEALRRGMPEIDWTVVQLWCPRAVAAERVAARATGDEQERMRIYDATPRLAGADVCVDTAEVAPSRAAELIEQEVTKK